MFTQLPLQGMHLWWPDSVEEIVYADKAWGLTYKRAKVHIGYKHISAGEGVVHSDYSYGIPIAVLETQLYPSNVDDWMSEQKCVVYDFLLKNFVTQIPCQQNMAICKVGLGRVMAYVISTSN